MMPVCMYIGMVMILYMYKPSWVGLCVSSDSEE
jgi:hypothetical protein